MSFLGAIIGFLFFVCLCTVVIYYWRRWKRRTSWSNAILPVANYTPAVPLTPQSPPLPPPLAKDCCLMCHYNSKNGKYDFCGESCRQAAIANNPLLIDVPPGHVTFEMVKKKFSEAWNCPMKRPCPPIKQIYKIVESPATRAQYDAYKSQHSNECFRYHGTSRQCSLGEPGNRYPCWSTTCPACCILRTSFRVSLANPGGAFGQGIYTSSASNKAGSPNYAPDGVLFLAKVTLGKVRYVSRFAEVKSLPPGYNSVVFDRMNGKLNESVVYEDAAIRPVFMIIFAI